MVYRYSTCVGCGGCPFRKRTCGVLARRQRGNHAPVDRGRLRFDRLCGSVRARVLGRGHRCGVRGHSCAVPCERQACRYESGDRWSASPVARPAACALDGRGRVFRLPCLDRDRTQDQRAADKPMKSRSPGKAAGHIRRLCRCAFSRTGAKMPGNWILPFAPLSDVVRCDQLTQIKQASVQRHQNPWPAFRRARLQPSGRSGRLPPACVRMGVPCHPRARSQGSGSGSGRSFTAAIPPNLQLRAPGCQPCPSPACHAYPPLVRNSPTASVMDWD